MVVMLRHKICGFGIGFDLVNIGHHAVGCPSSLGGTLIFIFQQFLPGK
jgi:hypothetical protein